VLSLLHYLFLFCENCILSSNNLSFFIYSRWRAVMIYFLLLIIWPNWGLLWIIIGNF
jgi:hypothetical protein